MTGWGTYTPADGCFQRVRYTGEPAQLPLEWHAHENGLLIRFSRPVDAAVGGRARSHFAQAWNYRYSSSYGSPELSPRHPGQPGQNELGTAWEAFAATPPYTIIPPHEGKLAALSRTSVSL